MRRTKSLMLVEEGGERDLEKERGWIRMSTMTIYYHQSFTQPEIQKEDFLRGYARFYIVRANSHGKLHSPHKKR